uniref:uncharacterized protein LOC120326490 isoform X2 n=1 Tax=Styela clava TaxID=7725 RepID=UPI00193ACF93|nr:uncharacterized protein LOC120326490 isoform X2 [Styela clava]
MLIFRCSDKLDDEASTNKSAERQYGEKVKDNVFDKVSSAKSAEGRYEEKVKGLLKDKLDDEASTNKSAERQYGEKVKDNVFDKVSSAKSAEGRYEEKVKGLLKDKLDDEASTNKSAEKQYGEKVKDNVFDEASSAKSAEGRYEEKVKDNDELEEVFRVLIRLIPDKSEWKAFVNDGLKMLKWEESETKGEKMKDLRRWKRVKGRKATPDNLCLIIREHFKNDSSIVRAMSSGFGALSDGINKISDAINNINIRPQDKTTNLQSVEGRTVIIGAGNVQYRYYGESK